jgi:hypothetical protein
MDKRRFFKETVGNKMWNDRVGKDGLGNDVRRGSETTKYNVRE